MSSLCKKIMTMPFVLCFVMIVCAFGFVGCTPDKIRVTFDAQGGYFVTEEGNKETLVLELDKGAKIDASMIPLPVRSASNTTLFTFDSWDALIPESAEQDVVIKAEWSASTRYYTIKFDANGGVFPGGASVIEEEYEYNEIVDVPGNPTKAGNVEYTYQFDGYSSTPVRVSGDATYTAQWNDIKNKYTVTFNANGGIISDGTNELSQYVLNSQDYGATFALPQGYTAMGPESTEYKDYVFGGWMDAPNGSLVTTLVGTTTVYAKWVEQDRLYDITFDAGAGVFADGSATKVVKLKYGESIEFPTSMTAPSKAKDARHEYSFQGFGIATGATVSGAATYTAIYAESDRLYDVTFYADSGYFGTAGTKSITVKFKYDEVITMPEVVPSKEPTQTTQFNFEGYTGLTSETKVTGEGMRFTATYAQVARKYLVTFDAGDGYFDGDSTKHTIALEFEYNENIVAPTAVPTKDATASQVFAFAGYSSLTSATKVTGEGMTFSAMFTPSVRKYNITFDAGDGEFANGQKTTTVELDYGEEIVDQFGANPTKAEDNYATYQFATWSPVVESVAGEATYTATYAENVKTYTASFYENVGDPTPFFTAEFKAVKTGFPTISAEDMAALREAYSPADPSTGFAGEWVFTLTNHDTPVYANGAAGIPSCYVYGEGTEANPFMVDSMDTVMPMVMGLSQAYEDWSAASDETVKAQILDTLQNTNFRLMGDLDFSQMGATTFSTRAAIDFSTPWFVGKIDGKKSETENYKIVGLNASNLVANGGALFDVIMNATISNVDIYLGDSIASLAGIAQGDFVEFNNVNVYNAEGVESTVITQNDNNESAYLWFSKAKSLTFNNCTNYANYTSNASYFGIFLGGYTYGDADKNSTLVYNNCVNEGDVVASSFVGMLYGNPSQRNFKDTGLTITDCEQNGVITAPSAGNFVGSAGIAFAANDVASLNDQVKGEGSIVTLASLDGRLAFDATQNLKLVEGEYDAGTYVLDTFVFARNADDATVRLNYSMVAVLDDAADSVDFGMPIVQMIDLTSYEGMSQSEAYDREGNLVTLPKATALDWSYMTGYTIKYAYVEAISTVVFDFAEYDDSYSLTGMENQSYVVTYYNADGDIAGYMNSNATFVFTEAGLQSALDKGGLVIYAPMTNGSAGSDPVANLTTTININKGQDVSLMLAGNIVGAESLVSAFVVTNGTLRVMAGSLSVTGEAFRVDSATSDASARLFLGDMLYAESTQDCCVYIRGSKSELVTSAHLMSTSTQYATIQGNGLLQNRIKSITINGGSIISQNCEAIYAPQTGILTINQGELFQRDMDGNPATTDDIMEYYAPVIYGVAALYVKSGNVTINGGTFVGTAAKADYVPNMNGCNSTGDALIIDACGYPGGNPNVTINGGMFAAMYGNGIGYYQLGDNTANIKIADEVLTESTTNFVAKIANAAGAEFAYSYYTSLASAVDAVPADNTEVTITLLNSVEGSGVKVIAGQNIVFDLNNKTYTVINPTVGSAGTETNGFQLLKGATVTFKNGAIDTQVAKILIQNYSDLTLIDVDLIGAEITNYVVSNNYGSLTVSGDTNITAADGKVAFDVYFGLLPSYEDKGVTVTFASDFTGTVTGNFEYYKHSSATTAEGEWQQKTILVVQEGCTGNFVGSAAYAAGANITLMGGTYTDGAFANEFVAEGYTVSAPSIDMGSTGAVDSEFTITKITE